MRLANAESRVLMLDYDGTLAPFRTARGKAAPYEGVRELLQLIHTLGHTRLVIVSGRPVKMLPNLLGYTPLPELWGTHGWERRLPGGERELWPLDIEVATALMLSMDLAHAHGFSSQCEVKPVGIALHWREMPARDAETLRDRARELWEPLLVEGHLALHEFDGGIELRVPRRDKGTVVDAILAESPHAFAAYLGDDFTDEDAFRSLGTRGLSVLVRPEPRLSFAQAHLRPPDEVVAFLRLWARLGAGES